MIIDSNIKMNRKMSNYNIVNEIKKKHGIKLDDTMDFFNEYISILERENILVLTIDEHKKLHDEFYNKAIQAIEKSKTFGRSGLKTICNEFYKNLTWINKKIDHRSKETYLEMAMYLLCNIKPKIVNGDKYHLIMINGILEKKLKLNKSILIFKSNSNIPTIEEIKSNEENIIYYNSFLSRQRPKLVYEELRKAKDIFDDLENNLEEMEMRDFENEINDIFK
ncbi:hypothetical protein Q8C87_004423 [Salmonella enterica]|nr:hypothetical protein [Salmonella enterica subsp. enterica serovar Johannesburg]ELI2672406.1 hypothetical protein [Salmonella enterica]